MKRRDFLKSAAIVPATVAATQWSAMAESLGAQVPRIGAAVYDERYADCRAFAEALARQGAALFAAGGDAVALWYGPLREHLARYGGSVAGMTTESDLSVSRLCAREFGLRMAYEGSHDCRTSGRMKHHLRGKGEEREVYAALLRADRPWDQAIAEALCRPPLSERIVTAFARVPAVTTPSSSGHPVYLTSWLVTARMPQGQAQDS
ncbi:MAG TPA: hypothetical protein VMM16_03295 [Verrucomicrobiae bacterium]|nr:hypothetical protein [Verrucomicrobiae bacterium]